MTNKITMPTKTLLQGAPYTPAHQTDIRKLFALVRAQLKK